VPEDLINVVSDDTVGSRVWMYYFEKGQYVCVAHNVGWDKNDLDTYYNKLQDAVTSGVLPGIVVQSEDQVVVFFVEDGDTWYKELTLYPKTNE
jgi:hypothetical protein